MGVDRPDDFDVPSCSGDGEADRGGSSRSAARVQVEVRDRFEYYESLRLAVRDVPAETPRAIAPDVPAETPAASRESSRESSFEVAAERFRAEWAEHRGRWPAEGREPVDRSGDPEGSWRGDSGRYLDRAANAEVEERCERIAQAERNVVSPAMREIEACDPERRLVGFDHRLKGLDRIKDKVAAQLQAQPDLTNAQAMATVKDAVRFTFHYSEERYTAGVHADSERLEARGFEQVERRNSWEDLQYKGINSRWREPETGLTFEVQFHTHVSFEAKQLTHATYERIRDPQTAREERRELEHLQREAIRNVGIPPGASEIPNYPQR